MSEGFNHFQWYLITNAMLIVLTKRDGFFVRTALRGTRRAAPPTTPLSDRLRQSQAESGPPPDALASPPPSSPVALSRLQVTVLLPVLVLGLVSLSLPRLSLGVPSPRATNCCIPARQQPPPPPDPACRLLHPFTLYTAQTGVWTGTPTANLAPLLAPVREILPARVANRQFTTRHIPDAFRETHRPRPGGHRSQTPSLLGTARPGPRHRLGECAGLSGPGCW
jgi:hypothetical protein